MGKRLFLLILAMLGVALTPSALMAADEVVAGEPEFHAVETVSAAEVAERAAKATEMTSGATGAMDEATGTTTEVTGTAYSAGAPAAGYAPAYTAAADSAPQTVNYTVTTYVNTVDEYARTASTLSYADIYKFKKLIYGHNSGNLLGNLVNRSVGEVFTITEGGVTRSYRVTDVAIYAKTADGNLEGNPALMRNIAFGALGHEVALMTCYGTPYGNGDASHRLVIYADEA